MPLLSDYAVLIFDCDGVILDSNTLKVQAMQEAIAHAGFSSDHAARCGQYFADNFGRSRFHHIQYFVDTLLPVLQADKAQVYDAILTHYANACKSLYLQAPLTDGVLAVLEGCTQDKYIASGSDQEELRWVLAQRGLNTFFKAIYGAPTKKAQIVGDILQQYPKGIKSLMLGDAVSDFEAAQHNQIDFLAYLPYSNVPDKMRALAQTHGFSVWNHWKDREC